MAHKEPTVINIKMKKLLIIFSICISFSIQAKSQDVSGSALYISFFKNFIISSDQSLGDQTAYFFSILIKTNQFEKIVSFEESKGMDSVLVKKIKEAYKKVDRNGLKGYGFKNSTLLLPIFLLNSTNTKYNNKEFGQMWTYKSKLKNNCMPVLPPLVIYYNISGGRSIN